MTNTDYMIPILKNYEFIIVSIILQLNMHCHSKMLGQYFIFYFINFLNILILLISK